MTIADMMLHLKSLLRKAEPEEPIFILRLFERQRSRRAMISLFLAVLEMVKLQAVTLAQKELFGEIALKRHQNFEQSLSSADAAERSRRITAKAEWNRSRTRNERSRRRKGQEPRRRPHGCGGRTGREPT